MKISSRIALNTISSWSAQFFSGILSVILVPIFINKLGKEGYGIAVLLGVIVSLSLAFDLGIRTALSRQLSEQVALKDHQRFNQLFCTGLVIYRTIVFCLAVLCYMFATFLSRAFNISPQLEFEAVTLIRWYGSITIFLSFIDPVFGAVLASNNRYDLSNYVASGIGILRSIVMIAVLLVTDTALYGWASVMLFSQILNLLVIRFVAYKVWPALKIQFRYLDTSSLRTLFGMGSSLFAIRLTHLLSIRSDPIVLTTFLGPVAVALYRPAVALCSFARPIVNSLSEQLHPVATAYHTVGKTEDLHKVLVLGTKYTLLMGIPVCIVLGFFAEPITRL